MDLPLTSFDSVFHIGSLERADKGTRGSSLEGHGLSFSPNEEIAERWSEIARLGGLPTWELEKPGARFVNAHALSKAQRKEISDWGVEAGYAEIVTVWHAVGYDSELDEETWMVCETKEEAELELPEDGKIRRRRDLKGTAQLDALVGQGSGLACFDLLLVAYVETQTELDGAFWNDIDDGWYSAPRGVILPGKVKEWTAEKVGGPRPALSGLDESASVVRGRVAELEI